MSTWKHDLLFGLRTLRQSPGFSAAAALVLALGIGANTSIFSVGDAFLFKPLPVPDVGRLLAVMERRADSGDWDQVSPANFIDWRGQNTSFERLSCYRWWSVNLTGQGDPDSIQAALVAPDLFDTLGARPLYGRTFLAEEGQAGRNTVALLSYGAWQRRFGGDPKIVGRNIKLDGRDYTVAGIMPREFDFPTSVEIWMPLVLDAKARAARNDHYLNVIGRLKPGVTPARARAEMQTIAGRLQRLYPATNRNWGVRVMSMRELMLSDLTRQYTVLLMVAVGFVLLIACANVANLQFARGSRRQKEIAIRAAMGASRWKVVRQLLVESVLLALAGAVAGLFLASWGIDVILAYMPPRVATLLPGWKDISLDGRALAFTLCSAVAAGVLAGVAPAWQASRPNLIETLKESGRGTSGSRTHRLRSVLVVAEVALAIILLAGAGLMVRGFRALLDNARFADPGHVLTVVLNLPERKYEDLHRRAAFFEQVLAGVESIPGVRAATLASRLPVSDGAGTQIFSVEGQPAAPGELRAALIQNVAPGFFRTLQVPLLEGRPLSEGDRENTQPVAIVSQSMARRFWPGRSAIGQRIRVGPANSPNPWMTVVGVAAEVRYFAWSRSPQLTIYRPYHRNPPGFTYLTVRTAGDPLAIVPAVRQRVASVDAEQPLAEIRTLAQVVTESTTGLAYVAWTMAILGFIALVLSSVGVYGVMAYAVSERTHEIGIRMALGAAAPDVLGMVLRRGLLLSGLGLATGLPVSFLLARLLASLIFGVSAADGAAFSSVSLVLAATALLACWIPARRATRIDPLVALRYE